MKSILSSVADFIFPPKCLLCGRSAADHPSKLICPPCLLQIKYITGPTCPKCGLPFVSPAQKDHFCQKCLTAKKYFTRARSVGYYHGILLDAIHKFKYNGKTAFSFLLGDLLANCSFGVIDFQGYDLLIPVPLHKKRLKERGFNQSLLLAVRIRKRSKIPIDYLSLKRIRWTDPQIGLSVDERLRNIRGAFWVKNQKKILGKKILLVDDVYTTGSTVNECSKTLIKSGARRVDILTLARAV